MAQVTIYINQELEAKIKKMASSLNISISKYISNILEQNTKDSWNPKIKEIAGSWKDFPDIEEIRKNTTQDIKREEF